MVNISTWDIKNWTEYRKQMGDKYSFITFVFINWLLSIHQCTNQENTESIDNVVTNIIVVFFSWAQNCANIPEFTVVMRIFSSIFWKTNTLFDGLRLKKADIWEVLFRAQDEKETRDQGWIQTHTHWGGKMRDPGNKVAGDLAPWLAEAFFSQLRKWLEIELYRTV